MSNHKLFLLVASTAFATACEGALDVNVRQHTDGVGIVDTYEAEYSWRAPEPCTLYLHERITDELNHVIEYSVTMNDAKYAIVYSIAEEDDYPVSTTVYDDNGVELLSVAVDPHDLVAYSSRGEATVEVHSYARGANDTSVTSHGEITSADALALVSCALPLRVELGAVPAFLLNKGYGGRITDDPDVVQGSETDIELLAWDGDVTILGAVLLQAVCLERDGWTCPCLMWSDQLAGAVPGWCGGSDHERGVRAGQAAVDAPVLE